MKIYAGGIGVDAGIIMICDENYYKEFGKIANWKKNDYSRKFYVSPGIYEVEWEIRNTYNGNIKGKGIVEIKSGNLIVSDPCYCIKNWDKWIDVTDVGKKVPDNVILITETGGDGEYNVNLKLEKKK